MSSNQSGGVYLIYGEEFLVKEERKTLTDKLIPEELKSTNLILFDGISTHLSTLKTELLTPSLFGGPKVVVCENTIWFSGTTDGRKILKKAITAWVAGDQKKALKLFSQFIGLSGVSVQTASSANDLASELADSAGDLKKSEEFSAMISAFTNEPSNVPSLGNDKEIEDLITVGFPSDTNLIFTALEVDKRKAAFKLLDRLGNAVECFPKIAKFSTGLDRNYFDSFVRDFFKANDKIIDHEALNYIYSLSGADVRKLESELRKVLLFAGDRQTITYNDVENSFCDFHDGSYFDFIDAIQSRDLPKSLIALSENLKGVSHPLVLLGTIAAELRKLIAARELLFTVWKNHWTPGLDYRRFVTLRNKLKSENPTKFDKNENKLFGMKDYPLFKLLKAARTFPMDHLMSAMEAVLEADIMLKSTKLASKCPETILEELVIRICLEKSVA